MNELAMQLLTKARPIDRHAEEKPHLIPLPARPFDAAEVVYRSVDAEGFVAGDRAEDRALRVSLAGIEPRAVERGIERALGIAVGAAQPGGPPESLRGPPCHLPTTARKGRDGRGRTLERPAPP